MFGAESTLSAELATTHRLVFSQTCRGEELLYQGAYEVPKKTFTASLDAFRKQGSYM